MLALSGLCERLARGWACLHTACPERSRREHLPVPKIPAAKPCISITSNLIQIKRLQVLYFGHLRKTGGRGSYQLVQGPGGYTGYFHRIFQAAEMQENSRLPLVLGMILKERIDRIGREGTVAAHENTGDARGASGISTLKAPCHH